ncbi:molybdenum cofactor synthesis domain-containing protein [Permianibacter aggregans]|uniref:Molybdenum cofactor biosynthesis protein B n=1 Tax=Permianibacter aggregans TaxID=1510150 RepID=A0A4R6UCJ3_9GAMM|nr:molybdenum cofactor synthesis domain-containing protein [Permianibacter aggregans]QGX40948.1 molybdenum cofactor biosynthesis protein [Permianibacter aggregans]TDQ43616.1 molybdenum cofactor biosynthesis protein B [Permianibacter aggregans]
MSRADKNKPFQALNIALMSVSDRHTLDTDDGALWLANAIAEAGHRCLHRELLRPNKYLLRARIAGWIADQQIQVIIVTGGTGLGDTDISEDAISVLFDRPVEGFGEEFRRLSFADIGSSAMQSRAFAGISNSTVIFVLPSSPAAIRLGWQQLIQAQLDARTGPCNMVGHLGGATCNHSTVTEADLPNR